MADGGPGSRCATGGDDLDDLEALGGLNEASMAEGGPGSLGAFDEPDPARDGDVSTATGIGVGAMGGSPPPQPMRIAENNGNNAPEIPRNFMTRLMNVFSSSPNQNGGRPRRINSCRS